VTDRSDFRRQNQRHGVVLFLLCAGLLGCPDKEVKKDKKKVAAAPVPVEVRVATRADLSETLLSTTTVASRKTLEMIAESPGVVTRVHVEVGDTVKARQPLLRMRREEVDLGLSAAKSAVKRLEREVRRMDPLLEKGIVSEQSVERVKDQLGEARGEVKRAELMEKDLRVVAPFDGVVARATVEVGQQVGLGTPLVQIVDPQDLIVDVPVPEIQLSKLYVGQRATIESDALVGVSFKGKVERISPVVDPRSGTVGVRVAVSSPEGETEDQRTRLRPGMFVKVRLATQTRSDVVTIPRRSVLRRDDITKVFTIRDGLAEERLVRLGIFEGNAVEVLEGVTENEQVVVLGQDGLRQGTLVAVQDDAATSP
jgi:membrane fusion protein, multidrug efflux system